MHWLAQNISRRVVGLDYGAEGCARAEAFTRRLGLCNCHVVRGDAHIMGLASDAFDTAILVDSMEHFASPEKVIESLHRVLRPGGRACIRFNPYYFRHGHHLTSYIRIHWAHLFFSLDTLLAVAQRVREELSREIPQEHLSSVPTREEYAARLNGITYSRFAKMVQAPGWRVVFWRITHACGPLGFLCKRIPRVREPFIKRISCVLEKI
jgi:SAM-dependent methyltransferase